MVQIIIVNTEINKEKHKANMKKMYSLNLPQCCVIPANIGSDKGRVFERTLSTIAYF
jgi:hypothetical protein